MDDEKVKEPFVPQDATSSFIKGFSGCLGVGAAVGLGFFLLFILLALANHGH
jgi:hypothetical protein